MGTWHQLLVADVPLSVAVSYVPNDERSTKVPILQYVIRMGKKTKNVGH